ncbi:MAG: spermidine/putrescine ABC transporter substrate-binding protein PotF [Pseudomonadales bacterium RIFCSPLOWO2_12_60_38]|uniref:Polyamine ABC transporter substrate-binding protein n=1 Tax=Pseudomonas azotoformans TaxID=47878 RepID=A0A4Q0HVY1_PSEAZ|nr:MULTISPECIES: polyamine ABC transporter substrate-binding protein [Pseudomonas]OHC31311.1 MAG: spermidine/putrescine ABC transporter substrate-binding protein PotF [Pseudomonadales bacterium RIFCSPLOWO2_12_60_38]OHC37658.1 MAG: spermidine/putrescine ABC transporter substrate-binding protein PotF [Pseudomonadales bacterium RIFCSPLOWO2_12_FULL_59_450]PMZ75808.1 polyamine ABC transporter substrate-binding protein [Pseudomonas sp. GW247-3R2A]AIB44524.1 spermidine/putrescine ABC transporter subst
MKNAGKTLLALSLMGAMAGAAQADNKVLHVYNWSDYIAPDTIANFEKESGIKVVYDVFDSNETLEAKLLAGKSGYDIVVPSNSFLAKQIKAGVYQELDKSKLSNYGNLNKSLLKAVSVSDPDNKHAFPYMWGSMGIGYNPEKVKAALGVDKIDSWDVLMKPENIAKLKSCGVSFLDSPTEMLPVALHYLGLPTDTTKKADLKQAEDLFMKIRPSIGYFHSSKYISDLANGNICVAVGYSGDIEQAKTRAAEAGGKVKIAYDIPKEGAGSFFDMVAIPKDAENVEAAYAFMNYLLKPDVMAAITNSVRFPNGNEKATALVDKDITSDPGIYPSAEVQSKLYAIADMPAATQREMTRSWTKIKSGK